MSYSKYFNLNSLNGKNGFIVNGQNTQSFLGTSANAAGDINGDGKDDIIIGAPHVDHEEPNVALGNGQAYVIFGSTSFQNPFNLTTLNGNNGFSISESSLDMLGYSVSGIGDINGDGKNDIAIGAPYSNVGNLLKAGKAYIIFGATTFQSPFDLNNLNGNNGFVINGLTSASRLGYVISGEKDFNGDGKDDIIISSPYSNVGSLSNAGRAYVIFGASSFQSSFNLNDLNGQNGFIISGLTSRSLLGISLKIGEDINGDGKADIIIGADQASPNNLNMAGQAYVIFGASSFQSSFNLNTLNGNNGFIINGIESIGMLGASVAIGGDINGDGKADIIIGANQTSPNNVNMAGQAYVIFGASSFQSPFNLNTLNGNNGFIINGLAPETVLGFPVNIISDINQDNKAEIIIGAVHASPEGVTHAGQAYILFGSDSFQKSFNVSDLNGNNGFIVSGLGEHNALSWSSSGAGDINNDGIADIIIGAIGASSDSNMNMNMEMTGQAYIIFGEQEEGESNSHNHYNNVAEIATCVTIVGAVTIGIAAYALRAYTSHYWPFNDFSSKPLATLEDF